MKIVVWSAAGAALWIGLACGGNVVVDGQSSGEGASGGSAPMTTSTTSTDGSGGAGANCPVPAPSGIVQNCGGVASSGPGGPSECTTVFCDSANNQYISQCSGATCVCFFNQQTLCTCALQGGTDTCTGAGAGCCPFSFATR